MGTAKRERQKAGRQSRREQAAVEAKKQKSRAQFRNYGVLAVVLVAIVVFFLLRDGGDDGSTQVATGPSGATTTTAARVASYGTTACPPVDGSAQRVTAFADSFSKCIDPAKSYVATLTMKVADTTYDVVVDLDAKAAPITVNNFVSLARSKFYDAVPCHRVIPNFMAQCGDPQGTGSGDPGYEFGDELPAAGSYKIGSVAMANSGPNTNGSQFFIITGQTGVNLNPAYSLFGQVRAGQDDVLKALDAAGNPDTAANGVPPLKPVGLTSVKITES